MSEGDNLSSSVGLMAFVSDWELNYFLGLTRSVRDRYRRHKMIKSDRIELGHLLDTGEISEEEYDHRFRRLREASWRILAEAATEKEAQSIAKKRLLNWKKGF